MEKCNKKYECLDCLKIESLFTMIRSEKIKVLLLKSDDIS